VTDCDRIRADAAGLAALPAGDAERREAWAHARGCPACARALEEMEQLQAVLGDVAPPPLGAGAPARAPRAIVSELRREARRRMLASAVAVAAAFALFVALARHRSPSRLDWALALALAASAGALGMASRRWAVVVVAVAPIAALGPAMVTSAAGALHGSLGVECIATELACAALVVVAAWLAIRQGTSSLAPGAVAAGAASGAVAGAAALQLTCPVHASLPHLLTFHVGGVLLAAAAAGALWGLAGGRRGVGPPSTIGQ
jgi:hypothetical protein